MKLSSSRLSSRLPAAIMRARSNAVTAASLCGDRFFLSSIIKGYFSKDKGYPPLPLHIKLMPHSFYRGDQVNASFLTQLADMHINGTVAHYYFLSPYPVQDLVA